MRSSWAVRRPARLMSVVALVTFAACRHAPSGASGTSGAASGRDAAVSGTLGDAATLGPRIVKLDGPQARLTYSLARPAYVVLLSVDPGRSIAPIATSAMPVLAGVHTERVVIPDVAAALRTVTVAGRQVLPSTRDAFEACVLRTTKPSSTRRVKRQVRTDSAGRPVDGGPLYEDVEVPGVDVEQAERICADRTLARAPTQPRPAGYLVLLASTAPLTWLQIDERLRTFSVTADDAGGTIQAVAEGLYAGRDAQWAGAYLHW